MQPFKNSSVFLELLKECHYSYIKQIFSNQHNSIIYIRGFTIVGLPSGYIREKHKTCHTIFKSKHLHGSCKIILGRKENCVAMGV